MATRASRDDIIRLRLRSHGLTAPRFRTPLEVAQRMLAVQAQDFAAGKWALGVRAPGSTSADVAAALNAGTIVRSWPMRGTLHFVPAPELNWMLQLTTPRMQAAVRTRHTQLDIDHATIEAARAAAEAGLEGGRALTRTAFLRMLDRAGIGTEGQRGAHLIGALAQTLTLCWGPLEGNQQALVLLDEWVPNPRRLSKEEALGEFVLRYLTGHGPATLKDFVWWSKLTVAEAKIGFAAAAEDLTELRYDDTSYFLPASQDLRNGGDGPAQRIPVLLLPGFDEYLLGYADRWVVMHEEDFTRVVPGKNGIFLPLILEHGKVIGTWRAPAARAALRAHAQSFEQMDTERQAAFAEGVGEYARFLERPVTVAAEPDVSAALI